MRLAKPKLLLIPLSHFLALHQPQLPSKVLCEHQGTGASPQQPVGWLIPVSQGASQPAAGSRTLTSQVLSVLTSAGVTGDLSALF